MTEPTPPEQQLPPPTGPAVAVADPPSGRRGPVVAAVLVAALAVIVAAVVLLAGGGGQEEPTAASTEPTSATSPAPSASSAPSATEAPSESAAPTATGSPPPSATGELRGLVADQVGPYRLTSIDEGDVLIRQESAIEAYSVSYQSADRTDISHQVGSLPFPEGPEALRRERIRERKEFGARVVSEEPYTVGDQRVGTLTITVEDGLYLALWTNGYLFATALSDDEDAVREFVAAAPY